MNLSSPILIRYLNKQGIWSIYWVLNEYNNFPELAYNQGGISEIMPHSPNKVEELSDNKYGTLFIKEWVKTEHGWEKIETNKDKKKDEKKDAKKNERK